MTPSKEMLVAAIKCRTGHPFRMGWVVYETIGISYINIGFYSPVNIAINWQIPDTKASIAAIIYHTKINAP